MGKGNRHRDEKGDRGSDRGFAQQRSFGGSGQKFHGTIGGALGQSENHSNPCFAAIKGVFDVKAKMSVQEKALASVPNFATYIRAKREMINAEKELFKVPAFMEYHNVRKELRAATTVLNEAKLKCEKCSFSSVAKSSSATPPA